jgi:hypothetical protein
MNTSGLSRLVGFVSIAVIVGACQSGDAGSDGGTATDASQTVDAGLPDAASVDAASVDAASTDAASVDAGSADAGQLPVDSGIATVDAGVPDSGATTLDAGTPSDAGADCGVVLKGSRMLGMDTNYAATDFTFAQSWAQAQSIGIVTGTNATGWSVYEGAGNACTSGAFSNTLTGLVLPALNATYTSATAQLTITISPIDGPVGGANLFPSDLAALPISDSNVICRFKKFLDVIFAGLPNVVFTNVQIGYEIDTNGSANTAAYWTDYATFLSVIAPYARAKVPGLKVGVTVTWGGAVNGSSAIKTGIQSLLTYVDEVGVTYYPLDPTTNPPYGMKLPSVVAGDFASLVAAIPSAPIYIQEIGYASSGATGCPVGSTANQALFVSNAFAAWDVYVSRIPFMSFLRMNDLSSAAANATAANYGLGSDACFVAYLQTLGFRTDPTPSANKPAWTTLANETHARGWW